MHHKRGALAAVVCTLYPVNLTQPCSTRARRPQWVVHVRRPSRSGLGQGGHRPRRRGQLQPVVREPAASRERWSGAAVVRQVGKPAGRLGVKACSTPTAWSRNAEYAFLFTERYKLRRLRSPARHQRTPKGLPRVMTEKTTPHWREGLGTPRQRRRRGSGEGASRETDLLI